MQSKKRQIKYALLISFSIFLVLGITKYLQISKAIAENSNRQMPPEAVTSIVVKKESWSDLARAVGNLTAVQGSVLSAELPGEVTNVNFESGHYVEKGAVLLQLNVEVENADLAGARATAEQANLSLERAKLLRTKNANSIADLELAIAKATQANSAVVSLEQAIKKKTLTAPFSGYVGIRKVNAGDFVTAGQPLVPLFALASLYVDFTLPQKFINQVKDGARIIVSEASAGLAEDGKVIAVDPNVDPNTRNFSVRAQIENAKEQLRPGMYVAVTVVLPSSQELIPIPASSITYAPYGNSVWILESKVLEDGSTSKIATQQFVKTGGRRGDQVAVISGLNEGQEIVTSGGFKLRAGSAVLVDNSSMPSNLKEPSPPKT